MNDVPDRISSSGTVTDEAEETLFVSTHLDQVFGLVYRIVRDEDEAQEITQESFIAFLQHRRQRNTKLLLQFAARNAVRFLHENRVALTSAQGTGRSAMLTVLLRDVVALPLAQVARTLHCSLPITRAVLGRARLEISAAPRALDHVHIRDSDLALYAFGDLAPSLQIRQTVHIAFCRACSRRAGVVRDHIVSAVRALEGPDAAAPFDGHWERQKWEMGGNIAVGLAAARCIEPVRVRRLPLLASALVAFLLLFMAVWVAKIPRARTDAVLASLFQSNAHQKGPARILTTPDTISVRSGDGALSLGRGQPASITAVGVDAVTAQYVDTETGQVVAVTVYGK